MSHYHVYRRARSKAKGPAHPKAKRVEASNPFYQEVDASMEVKELQKSMGEYYVISRSSAPCPCPEGEQKANHRVRKAVIRQRPSRENGWMYKVMDDHSEMHWLTGIGAPQGRKVGDEGTITYLLYSGGAMWSWSDN